MKVVLDENALLVEEREAQHRKVKAQLAAKDREGVIDLPLRLEIFLIIVLNGVCSCRVV